MDRLLRSTSGEGLRQAAFGGHGLALLPAWMVVRDEAGEVVRGQGEANRFNNRKDHSWVVLEPELVAEVRYDQMEGDRFRHVAQLARWRPDREPSSCTFAQLDLPVAYDLDAVLSGR